MFNSDIFANRPAFGIVGRIFISIDTAAIYRDTGTAWDLIADGGSASTNIYNSNGTLTGNRVLSDGGFGLSFTPTTHIGSAAIGGGGSGKLIVGSSTADNGIQIFGANSPSLRIDNAQSGGTQRFVFGLATATNNFIQGAAAGEFCISTQSAGNMLFGMWQTTNASEVMRITTANNFLIGSSVDNGNRLQVTGNIYTSTGLNINTTSTDSAQLKVNGTIGVNDYNQNTYLYVTGGVAGQRVSAFLGSYASSSSVTLATFARIGGAVSADIKYDDSLSPLGISFGTTTNHSLYFYTNNVNALQINNTQNAIFTNSIKTGTPTSGTAADWKFGTRVAATVVFDTTQYIQLDVNGTLYKLAIVN